MEDNKQTPLRRNPAIEAILANSELAIEYQFGIQCLNRYLSDLALLAHGADYKALGISERREASLPFVITEQGATIQDRALIYNSSLTPPGSTAVIRISGFMQTESSGGSSGVRGMRGVADDLRAAYANPNISGILLDVNSGGGEIMSMEVVTSALAARNKPVISHVTFAASAAYGSVAATDEIIALSDFSKVGSVGAVISLNKFALQEYADEYLDFYGQNAPNKNAEFRAALAGDFSGIQVIVDEATDRFQSKVRALRALRGSDQKITDTLSGNVFSGPEAKRRGLIDGIGGLEYALKRLESWVRTHVQRAA